MFTTYAVMHTSGEAVYVGHTEQPLKYRFYGFGNPARDTSVDNYVREHGKEHFYIQSVQIFPTRDEAKAFETYIVQSWKPKCNGNDTGQTGTRKGDPNHYMKSPEYRAKISGENSPTKRPEVRAKISAKMLGCKNHRFGKPAHNRHPCWQHADEIRAKYDAGDSSPKIAKYYNCSKEVIVSILKSTGDIRKNAGENHYLFGKTPHNKLPCRQHDDEICAKHLTGDYTQSQLAEEYGCSPSTIRNILKSKS